MPHAKETRDWLLAYRICHLTQELLVPKATYSLAKKTKLDYANCARFSRGYGQLCHDPQVKQNKTNLLAKMCNGPQ